MQIFENFIHFDNILIINTLHLISLLTYPNTASSMLISQFLFRRSFQTSNYTLLNILPENSRFFPENPALFQKLYRENFSTL